MAGKPYTHFQYHLCLIYFRSTLLFKNGRNHIETVILLNLKRYEIPANPKVESWWNWNSAPKRWPPICPNWGQFALTWATNMPWLGPPICPDSGHQFALTRAAICPDLCRQFALTRAANLPWLGPPICPDSSHQFALTQATNLPWLGLPICPDMDHQFALTRATNLSQLRPIICPD